jgi:tetratricopeptide (TPR) repeat protein
MTIQPDWHEPTPLELAYDDAFEAFYSDGTEESRQAMIAIGAQFEALGDPKAGHVYYMAMDEERAAPLLAAEARDLYEQGDLEGAALLHKMAGDRPTSLRILLECAARDEASGKFHRAGNCYEAAGHCDKADEMWDKAEELDALANPSI